jgi:hypothetical protein
MSDTFKVGEVAILVALNPLYKEFEGADVVIESSLVDIPGSLPLPRPRAGHRIRLPNGEEIWSVLAGLRKKPPKEFPREALGSWSECPWQPEDLRVSA